MAIKNVFKQICVILFISCLYSPVFAQENGTLKSAIAIIKPSEGDSQKSDQEVLRGILDKAWTSGFAVDPNYIVKLKEDYVIRIIATELKYNLMFVLHMPDINLGLQMPNLHYPPGTSHKEIALKRIASVLWQKGVAVDFNFFVELNPALGQVMIRVRALENSNDYIQMLYGELHKLRYTDIQAYPDMTVATASNIPTAECSRFFK